ncbi:DNA (cytosine-5-)-methyltransferase [Streptomyces sp. NPDC059385]|uniref:DNA (cytosine-5-)-methyltransferase n=1 Tax=Streptomyces sp. NPDC059385 TaxID=3346817 RepID=UPI0036C7F096
MTNLSLCSGFGGLDLAVESITGNKTLVYAENDRYAAQVMAARFPWATNLGDITAIDWATVAAQHQIDTISAGFPCQDISNAGKRKGITGARSGIWKQVAEAVRHTRPRLVFLENVEAIRSRGLDVVVADLAALGYDARWTGLPARDVGAPHLRWRWFCVAYPTATDPERGGRYRWPGDVAEAEGRNEPADGRDAAAGSARGLSLMPTPTVADSRGTRNFTSGRSEGAKFNAGKTLTDVAWLLPTPKASDGPHGGPNQRDTNGNYYLPGIAVRLDRDWVSVDGIDYGPAIRRWEGVLGRPAPEPTEPGQRGNRRITARFVEWAMGADDGWFTDPALEIPRAQQIKIGGNGVVTRQAIEGYRRLLCADLDAMAAAA